MKHHPLLCATWEGTLCVFTPKLAPRLTGMKHTRIYSLREIRKNGRPTKNWK